MGLLNQIDLQYCGKAKEYRGIPAFDISLKISEGSQNLAPKMYYDVIILRKKKANRGLDE